VAPYRRPGSVAVVSVAFALLVLCGVHLLALIRPVGHLVLIELVRAALICTSVALAAWVVLRTKTPDGRRVPLLQPGLGRCAMAGLLVGIIAGAPALAAGAIPEPTDSPGGVAEMAVILGFLGGILGLFLGLAFGLVFARYAAAAFRRTLRGTGDALEGSVIVACSFLGLAGAVSGMLHASGAAVDVLGIAMLLLATLGFAIVAKRDFGRAAWLARITAGQLRDWSIVPRTSPLLLPLYIDGSADDGVLAFNAAAEEGTFRTAPQLPTPIALIDATGERTTAHLRSRGRSYAGRAVMCALALVGVFGVYVVRDRSAPSWDSSPQPIARGHAMTNLASAEGVMCARRSSDRRLACWGSNAGAILGTNSVAYRTPEPDARLGPIRTFAIANERACAVPEAGDHRAVCWFAGDATLTAPVGPPEVVELALGGDFTVAVTADGSVWRWGADPARESKVTTPERVQGLAEIAHVAAGHAHALALGRDGRAYCWGASGGGACGVTELHVSVKTVGEGPFDAVAARQESTWLRKGGGFQTYGPVFSADTGFFHETRVRQYAFSDSDACFLGESGRVTCTRGNKAGPNGVFGWGVLEITGNGDGYCATTASDIWCWSGYSLLFSIFA
jgi:hypothetical protein